MNCTVLYFPECKKLPFFPPSIFELYCLLTTLAITLEEMAEYYLDMSLQRSRPIIDNKGTKTFVF